MNKTLAIKVQNLTKTYKLYKDPKDRLKEALNPFKKKYHNNFHALNNVSFEIKKGETVGIIGRNGSGKSTLLKMITGVLTPTSGRVNVHGKISAILELGAGFNPELNGMENIYLNTSINGMSKEETDKKIEEIVDFSELGEFIYQPIKTYSSGMKARLGFAVAINVEPDILIVDEALAVGDAAFQRKCYAKMEQIREAGATILFVSHSANAITDLCTNAIWLSNGEKIIEGEPKLVTGLYMKNTQEKYIDKKTIKKEFLEFENNRNKIEKKKQKKQENIKEPLIEEYYNKTLESKSIINYEEKGAKIDDVKVTTLDGEKVNVLVHGREYIYTYKVIVLDEKIKELEFGSMLKNKSGIAIGGGVYPEINKYVAISKSEYIYKLEFVCLFNKGEYFFNAGIRDKNRYIHRIVDAYMIKVINSKNNFTGNIKFFTDIEVKES